MSDFLSGITVGVIILQTAVFAPTIFTTIDLEPAGKLLRALFPKFFRLLVLLAIANAIALWLGEEGTVVRWILVALSGVLPMVCAAMVPPTNRATDRGDAAAASSAFASTSPDGRGRRLARSADFVSRRAI